MGASRSKSFTILSYMKTYRILSILFCLCVATLAQAQTYVVDCLVAPELKAVSASKSTDFDGTRTVLYLRNGATVQVVGRRVVGPDGLTASATRNAGDSVGVRQIKAVIAYQGRRYLAEARWLRYADQNPPSASDRFASDNFRPRPQLAKCLPLPRIDMHAAATRTLYGPLLPLMALLLMAVAVWLILRTRFVLLSALPFVASAAIVVYMAVMIDWDALWWCNPDYVGLPKAIGGALLVALFMVMTFFYMFCATLFGHHSLLVWPFVVGYLAQWPALLLSLQLTGSPWPALAVCYGIPILVNGLRARLYGVVMTAIGIVALHLFVITLAVVVQISLWILMALALASPVIGIAVSTLIGKMAREGQQKWVWRDGRAQYVHHARPTDRSV